jgi:predicted transcriptional regulator of viral defense system
MVFGMLTELDVRFFGYVQSGSRTTIASGELVRALGLAPTQEKKLLSRLARRRLIARVRRGLYLLPPRFPVGGTWSPSEAQALSALMADQNGRYQVSGPNAFARYGWDGQVPTRVFAYNDRISGDRTVGGVRLTLAKVAAVRLGGTEVVRTPEGIDLVYASKPRALMDAVYDWSRFNTLPGAFEWIHDEVARDDGLAAELVEATLKYGNQGTLRRIGLLLETAGVAEPLLRKLHRALRPTSSFVAWVPTLPKRGSVNNRWKVLVNDGERAGANMA